MEQPDDGSTVRCQHGYRAGAGSTPAAESGGQAMTAPKLDRPRWNKDARTRFDMIVRLLEDAQGDPEILNAWESTCDSCGKWARRFAVTPCDSAEEWTSYVEKI